MFYGRPVSWLLAVNVCGKRKRFPDSPEQVSRSRARRGVHYRGDSRKSVGHYDCASILRTSLVKLDNSLPLNAQTGHQTLLAKNERIDI
jgi:hypothetical protein